MATLFSDNFDTGTEPATANWLEQVGTIALSGAKVVFTSSGATFNYLTTKTAAHAAVADCAVTVKLFQSFYDGGPILRQSGSGATPTCYYWDLREGNTLVDFYRRVSGTDTLVATVTLGANAVSGDTFKVQVSGIGATVTFKCYKNAVQQGADVLDTNAARIVAAGQTGIISWDATLQADDFLVEDISAALLPATRRKIRPFPFTPGRSRWR